MCGAANICCNSAEDPSKEMCVFLGQDLLTTDLLFGESLPGQPSTPLATAGMSAGADRPTSSGGDAAANSPANCGKGKSGTGDLHAGHAASASTPNVIMGSPAERNRQAQRRYRQRQRVRYY